MEAPLLRTSSEPPMLRLMTIMMLLTRAIDCGEPNRSYVQQGMLYGGFDRLWTTSRTGPEEGYLFSSRSFAHHS
eukprot:scaffold4425_cov168-Amphora_coffeaeformis.AAC.12